VSLFIAADDTTGIGGGGMGVDGEVSGRDGGVVARRLWGEAKETAVGLMGEERAGTVGSANNRFWRGKRGDMGRGPGPAEAEPRDGVLAREVEVLARGEALSEESSTKPPTEEGTALPIEASMARIQALRLRSASNSARSISVCILSKLDGEMDESAMRIAEQMDGHTQL
jgi:hypothetical protein